MKSQELIQKAGGSGNAKKALRNACFGFSPFLNPGYMLNFGSLVGGTIFLFIFFGVILDTSHGPNPAIPILAIAGGFLSYLVVPGFVTSLNAENKRLQEIGTEFLEKNYDGLLCMFKEDFGKKVNSIFPSGKPIWSEIIVDPLPQSDVLKYFQVARQFLGVGVVSYFSGNKLGSPTFSRPIAFGMAFLGCNKNSVVIVPADYSEIRGMKLYEIRVSLLSYILAPKMKIGFQN